jgi:alkanesulfonate monooxygenase SsuD/methylene tetrahydromethanopterin reductase-like flavin-dependent oxidoreductase (luciferase family)
VAKQAATLDRLSGGRLVLGVGVGWNEGEYRNVGADFHRRGRILDESIAVLRNLFAGGVASFVGEVYSYRAWTLADAWHGDDVTPVAFAGMAFRVREGAARAGRTVTANVRLTVDLFGATGTSRGEGRAVHVSTGGSGAPGMRGSFEEMRAAARQYRDAGATDLVCQFEHDTPDQHVAFVRAFAREVVQHVRD